MQAGTSWGAPLDVPRIPPTRTDTQIAVEQVQRLARHTAHAKVKAADSRYRARYFVRLFAAVPQTHALVQLQNNGSTR